MELTTKHIGAYGGNPASIIELTVTDLGSTITTEVTDFDCKVDQGLIDNLREIADELEKQNELIDIKG